MRDGVFAVKFQKKNGEKKTYIFSKSVHKKMMEKRKKTKRRKNEFHQKTVFLWKKYRKVFG